MENHTGLLAVSCPTYSIVRVTLMLSFPMPPSRCSRAAKLLAAAAGMLLLAACQSAPIERDYDVNRDYTQYRNWTWAEPRVSYTPDDDPRIQSDLTTQRVLEAVSGQLDVRGLRPAQDPQNADLKVRVHVISDQRQDNVTTSFGGSFGTYRGWGGWGAGPGFAETRTVDYQVMTLQIDLLDAADGQLVWRGSDEHQMRRSALSPAERSRLIQEMVTKVLSGFPP